MLVSSRSAAKGFGNGQKERGSPTYWQAKLSVALCGLLLRKSFFYFYFSRGCFETYPLRAARLWERLMRSCFISLLSRRISAHSRSHKCGEVLTVVLLTPFMLEDARGIIMQCDKNMLPCSRSLASAQQRETGKIKTKYAFGSHVKSYHVLYQKHDVHQKYEKPCCRPLASARPA